MSSPEAKHSFDTCNAESPPVTRATVTGSGAPRPGRVRSPWPTLAILAVVLAVLTGFTVVGRLRARSELEQETRDNAVPTVSVIHPKRSSQQVEIVVPGDMQAFEDTPIYARVSGYLTNWETDIGTHVRQGQSLAEIDTPELDEQLNQARAALAQARANLEIARISADRWQALLKSDSVSQQDTQEKLAMRDAREADVNAAEADVQRLTKMTDFKRLTAPFTGIVTARNVDVGMLITAGSGREIFHLAKTDPLRVYLSLPQTYSQIVKPGDEAMLTLTEIPGQTFTGKVVRTSGSIDPASRTLLTEVQVPNHDGHLLPGAHTMVKLIASTGDAPVVVPVNTLLFRNELGMMVGVVGSNGIVRLARVNIGRDFGTSVEIVRGLSDADQVIVNPSDSLESGVQVRIATPEAPVATAKHE
jgi:RND family efflux transporter MFP subunit